MFHYGSHSYIVFFLALPKKVLFGWGGRRGGLTDPQYIREVFISTSPSCYLFI